MRATMAVTAVACIGLFAAACSEEKTVATSAAPSAAPSTEAVKMGLKITDLKVGSGAEAVEGKTVSVHYTGWLESNHKQFDSSYDRSKPFEFRLGAGNVIKGWDMGVAGMKVGGKRNLVIPATLGYGSSGAGAGLIPPDATLVFDVELLEVK